MLSLIINSIILYNKIILKAIKDIRVFSNYSSNRMSQITIIKILMNLNIKILLPGTASSNNKEFFPMRKIIEWDKVWKVNRIFSCKTLVEMQICPTEKYKYQQRVHKISKSFNSIIKKWTSTSRFFKTAALLHFKNKSNSQTKY